MSQPSAVQRALGHPAVAWVAIPLASLLAYANSFRCEFVFDDWPCIRDNPLIRDLGNFGPGGAGYADHRWVGYLSFALNYAAGGLGVTGFHAVNLAIHAANALLVYALVVVTFRTERLAHSTLADSSRGIALAAALLFATHPIQSQAVTYVVQRFASLATLFYVLAIVLYVRWRLAEPERPIWKRLAGYLPALVAAAFAMKTKEIAFTLPAAIAAYELTFLRGQTWRRVVYLLPLAAIALVVPLSLLNVGKPIGEILAAAQEVTKVQTAMSRWDYLTTQLAVVVTYLRLLALPVGQNIDHDYPLYRSLLEPKVLGSLAVNGALVVVAAYFLRRTSPRAARPMDPAARLVSFGIVWFFLTLSVESSFIPIMDLIYEHRVYLPSVGFFAAVATGGALVARRYDLAAGRLVASVAAALSIVLAVMTFERNRVWASSWTLWSDAVEKSPNKTRPHANLARTLAAMGRDAEAVAQFEAVVRINPRHESGYNNLAVYMNEHGRTDEAVHYLEVAMRVNPDHPEPYFNLASIRMEQHRNAEAAELLYKAIALDPQYVAAYANLSGLLNQLGRPAETVRLVEGNDALLRNSVGARFNLGVAHALLGNAPAAERELSALSRLAPDRAVELAAYLRARRVP